MIVSDRFYIDKDHMIVDRLDPGGKISCPECLDACDMRDIADVPEFRDLRKFILGHRLHDLVADLLGPSPSRQWQGEWMLERTLRAVIVATALPTTDPVACTGALPAIEVRLPGNGLVQFTSISLFVKDVESQLHKLYGPVSSKTMAPISSAVFAVTEVFLDLVPEYVVLRGNTGMPTTGIFLPSTGAALPKTSALSTTRVRMMFWNGCASVFGR